MKKKNSKVIVTVLLCISMLSGIFDNFQWMPVKMTEEVYATGLTLNELMNKFPNGKYWNHISKKGGHGDPCNSSCNNPDGTTSAPCYNHNGTAPGGKYDCNVFDGGWQCRGFARKLAFDAFGSYATTWKYGTMAKLKPGDVLRYKDSITTGHTVFVIGVNGNAITVGEANAHHVTDCPDCNCKIRWGHVIYKENITVLEIKSAPRELQIGSNKPKKPSAPSKINISSTDLGLGDIINSNWQAVNGATQYTAKLVCTTNSANNQVGTVGGNSASFKISKAGAYKISVLASNSTGSSSETASSTFVVHDNVKVKYVDWDNKAIGKQQTIKWNSNAVVPVAPSREGYTFNGWSSDGKNIKSDTTIKAQYNINSYSVAFVDYKGDVIGRVQKVKYMSAAVEPVVADVPCKEGYKFAGWDSEDYKSVKKSLTIKATYLWENSNLPIITNIQSAIRNSEGTGYTVKVKMSNFPTNFTKGKLVVELMTQNGKMVASETHSISMPSQAEITENVTVLYSGIASIAKVSMIGVLDDETTGTPKSKIVQTTIDLGNEWSNWNITVPSGEGIIKESRTEYRYKDSKVIKATSTPQTPTGYALSDTKATGTYTAWGSYSAWSQTAVSSNSLRDVQSQNGYRVYAWVCGNCGTRDELGGGCSKCNSKLYWNQMTDTMSGYSRGYKTTHPTWGTNLASGRGRVTIDGVAWCFELNGTSNGEPQSASVSGNGYGQVIYPIYRYRTRQEYKNYTYWQKDFSAWQATAVSASSTKKVETRTTYRFKTNSTEVTCYNYKRYRYTNINNGKVIYSYTSSYADGMDYPGEWEYYTTYNELAIHSTVDDNIKLYNGTGDKSWYRADVNTESSSKVYQTVGTLEDKTGTARIAQGTIANAAGKVATLIVYKGKNEDPTASQIEYINQTVIGSNGAYRFDYITKEEPTSQTGDYIVTLGIEGATKYQVIDIINAPKKVYTVNFVDNEGNAIGEQKSVVEGGTVEEPSNIPVKTGYDFIGWDTGLRNIRENMVITAKYSRRKCTVLFVDSDNTALGVKTFDYGAELQFDTVPTKEGKKFSHWEDLNGKKVVSVSDNIVVKAAYNEASYTIIFKDWDGNTLSNQSLKYGQSATIPEKLADPNKYQVFAYWNNYSNAMYATSDAIITPVAKYKNDSKTPEFTVKSGNYKKEQKINLFSTKSNTEFYYRIYSEANCGKYIYNDDFTPAEDDKFKLYEGTINVSKNTVIFAYAVEKNANSSKLVKLELKFGGEHKLKSMPKISFTKVSNIKGKKISLKWKNVSSWAKKDKYINSVNYQIQYSTDKSFKKGVKTVTYDEKTSSGTLTKLKKGKVYYVRVRYCVEYDNNVALKLVKKYSAWSGIKKVKVSK